MKKLLSTTLLCSTLLFMSLEAVTPKDIKSALSKSKNSFTQIYQDNLYQPLWLDSNGLNELGKELLEQIDNDKTVAPDLRFYKLYKSVKKALKNKEYSARVDLALTKLYFNYMHYLIRGNINWKKFDENLARLAKKYDYTVAWEHFTPPYSAKKILELALLNGSFQDKFSQVEPTRFKYHKLKKYLEKYIAISKNGGWKTVSPKRAIHVGESDPSIPKIRKRLKLVGDLNGCSASMDDTIYDSCMAKAVKRFKLRHGYKASSTIGKKIRTELRRPVSYYIKKMRLNLDRFKWSNPKKSRVQIQLNIPAFRLYLYDGDQLVTTMRVVTGKKDHPTPVFSDVMTSIVVNPYWRIPESIVRKEMLKHLIKNPKYYERQHKYLYKGWGENSEKIDPSTVNWKKYVGNKKHIPYHFMQDPSSKNALGKIKFLFPNKYSVYIHDTPSKRLFFREVRAFSHGCMRIQKPRELLKALSLYNSNIKVDKMMRTLGTNKKTSLGLRRKIPIDITYFTSFVDDYGNLHFRRDIYGYDRLQLKNSTVKVPALKEKKSAKKQKHSKSKKKQKEHKKSPQKKATVKKSIKKNTTHKKVTPKKPKSDYEVVEIGY